MKIKINDVLGIADTLNQLILVPLPVAVSFRIGLLTKNIQPHLKTVSEQKNDLAKKLGIEDKEKKGQYSFEGENKDKFNEEMKKLGDVKVDVKFDKIKLEELGKMSIEPGLLNPFLFEL